MEMENARRSRLITWPRLLGHAAAARPESGGEASPGEKKESEGIARPSFITLITAFLPAATVGGRGF